MWQPNTLNCLASLRQNQSLDLAIQMCLLLWLSQHDTLLRKHVVPQREQVAHIYSNIFKSKHPKSNLLWTLHDTGSSPVKVQLLEIRTLSQSSLAGLHCFQSFAAAQLKTVPKASAIQ